MTDVCGLALTDLCRIALGVDRVVRAPPKLDPLLNLLASSHVTIEAAPLLDRLNSGVDGSSGFRFPFLG